MKKIIRNKNDIEREREKGERGGGRKHCTTHNWKQQTITLKKQQLFREALLISEEKDDERKREKER